MNALCAIDNGLLSPNGLLTPQPPTNLAVNYTITIPLDSDPDLVLHYPFNQNILNYGSSTSLSTNLGPNTGVSDATIVPASGSKVSLSSNQSIFNNGTSLYQSNSNNSSYLSIANIPTNSNGYSFSLWVYFTSISTSTGVIFSFTSGTSATNRIVFYTDSTQPNKLIFSCNNTPNFISNIYPVLNTWYHYVWTLDKINNNRIYVNGVLQVTATTPTYVSFTSDNNSIFGDKPFPSNYGQQGYMNDFRYYNRILDSAEVYQLYNIYSLKINSGFQWQAFYGIQTSITQITTYLPTTGSLNSFQYNSYYSGGNNNTLFSTSSNLLTTINYANTIASANNIFGFNTNTAGTANAGLNIGLLVYGYFRPDISGVWNLKLDTDNHGTLWFNDGSGGSSFWPPTDTNYRITGNVTVPSYNTASLIAGTYYPMQITWSQFIGGSKFIFSITPPSGTITTDGTGYFFSQKPTTPIYTDLSLVLYYPFDQNIYNYASGFPVLDSNFTGTKTNININNVTYKVGNGSLYKDASNNSQYLYFNTIPQNTGGYSFAFWFNFTSLITTGTGISFGFWVYPRNTSPSFPNFDSFGDIIFSNIVNC
jgi:hypothetical protein